MIQIRPARPADGPLIAEIRAETWRAAYAGLISSDRLAALTSPDAVAREGAWRAGHVGDGHHLIAESDGAEPDGAEPDGAESDGPESDGAGDPRGVGFAILGPERGEDDPRGEPLPGPPDRDQAELYAIYVRPAWWGTGAGRALLQRALALAAEDGYADISLWVLEGNARGRRFYDRAGFQPTGESAVLTWLGGLTEVRYRRPVR